MLRRVPVAAAEDRSAGPILCGPLDSQRYQFRHTLAGCDRLSESPDFTKILASAEAVSRFVQKALTGRSALAREYTEADLSAEFRADLEVDIRRSTRCERGATSSVAPGPIGRPGLAPSPPSIGVSLKMR
jgi:hypothetical protein